MADSVLTLIDLSGIQDYVFASNRLRDAVGGAVVVAQLTSPQVLQRCGIPEDDVVIRNGGNLLFESPTSEVARSRVTAWSMELNRRAAPMRAAVVHQPIGSHWAATHQALRDRAAVLKREGLAPTGFGGLGVTERCDSTGLPAVGLRRLGPDASATPASRMLMRWRTNSQQAELVSGFEEPTELDELGRSFGEVSLLGIVHVDLNQVGAAIAGIEGRENVRAFSVAMEAMLSSVQRQLVERTAAAVDVSARGGPSIRLSSENAVQLQKRKDGNVVLPLRTVLVGGDDLTFVCDGRLALWMAELTLNLFKDLLSTNPVLSCHGIGAAAGVAITQVRSPFVAGYGLASHLCQNVKHNLAVAGKQSHFGIDWEYSPQGQFVGERPPGGRPYDVHAPGIGWQWLTREALSSKLGMLRSGEWLSRRSDRYMLLRSAENGQDAMNVAVATVGELPEWFAAGEGKVLGEAAVRDLADLNELWWDVSILPTESR